MGFINPLTFFRILLRLLQQLIGVLAVLLVIPLLLAYPYSLTSEISGVEASKQLYSAALQVGEKQTYFQAKGSSIFEFVCEVVYLVITGTIVAASIIAVTEAAKRS